MIELRGSSKAWVASLWVFGQKQGRAEAKERKMLESLFSLIFYFIRFVFVLLCAGLLSAALSQHHLLEFE